ncbi:MAG: acetolactate synthase small subunit [Pseudomonadota bacterium]|nr:acetolactate synthase small subunit [Pseudomonadota bacterium]
MENFTANEVSMYVISMITQNRLCVLQRVSGMFSRYRINIEHINISRHSEELSYWNVVIYTTEEKSDLLVKQLNKIIELVSIKIIDKVPLSKVNKQVINDKL